MLTFRLGLSGARRMQLDVELVKAKQAGDMPRVNRVLSILALAEGMSISDIARMLRVSPDAVREWLIGTW
jgi:DNA-directed RNA polymerase specialized sigma24 family protein